MYATDAHIAVRAKIKAFTDFDDDEIKLLDGKFIHRAKFKTLFDASYLKVEAEGLLDVSSDILYKFSRFEGKYVSINKLLDERLAQPSFAFDVIGLNPNLLYKLHKCMIPFGEYAGGLHLHFADNNKNKLVPAAIIAKHPDHDFKDLVGLIMPIALK